MCYSFVKGIVCDIYNKFNYLCVLQSVMKTVDKFILKSYLGPMFMTFFIVMFILLMNFLWRYIDELVGKGLPFSVIIELLFFRYLYFNAVGIAFGYFIGGYYDHGKFRGEQ